MRGNRKKMMALLMLCCITLVGAASGNCTVQAQNICTETVTKATSKTQLKGLQKEDKEADAAQRAAKKAYDDLYALRSKDESIQKVYAGAYIADDNVLVVNLTTSSQEIKDKIQQCTTSQQVRFTLQKYSYDELRAVQEEIAEKIEKENKYRGIVWYISVHEIDNVVEVGLSDLSYIDDFKADICDAPCIQFKKCEKMVPAIGKIPTSKGIQYAIIKNTKNAGEVAVRGVVNRAKKSITIPATITYEKKKYKVVSINKNAFQGMKKLKKVSIGKNVKKLDKQVFKNCKKLQSVKILSKNCAFADKSIWKGTSKKLVIKVPKSALNKMQKRLKKSGIKKSAVSAL